MHLYILLQVLRIGIPEAPCGLCPRCPSIPFTELELASARIVCWSGEPTALKSHRSASSGKHNDMTEISQRLLRLLSRPGGKPEILCFAQAKFNWLPGPV